MRKLAFVVCLVLVFAFNVHAQDKIDSAWNCAKATVEHSLDAGDQTGHAYVISQSTCTATKGEINGDKENDGVGTEFHDVMTGKNTWHGVFVESLAGGDKIFYNYKGTAKITKDQMTVSETWTISGGTGKYKTAKGQGTCAGKGNPDGSSSVTCKGTISTAVAAPAKKQM